jgi:carbonic anhydrase
MGEPPGSVFVQRSVANMVVNTDNNLLSALQYAIAYLKIPHIIVCGHYECGGVRASVTRFNHMPPLENWLRNIRDVYRLHRKELDAIKDPEKRHRRLVELNVVEQCLNVYKTGVVQRRRMETKNEPPYTVPQIHGVVFDPKDGILKRVPVDFEELSDSIDGIYELYEPYEEATADISPITEAKMVLEVDEEWPTLAKAPVA